MTWPEVIIYIFFPVAGYLLGAVPFAWVIGKAHGVDIRTTGSKNIGATNLGRTLGAKYFWQAFSLDALKGFLPVLICSLFSRKLSLPSWAPLLTAAACFLGHVFPIYLKFKGGKGVATSFGVVLGFWPLYTIAGLLGGAFFVFMLLVYRYISLASITAAAVFAALVVMLSFRSPPYVNTAVSPGDRVALIAVAGFFALVIIFRHRANIARLMKGTEPKIGQREIEKAKLKPQNPPPPPDGR